MDGTVLIADDDRTIRTVLTQALGRAGCRVHATGSLAQLTRWVEEGRGDAVITDVVMPDGNGIDLIPAIRRARPNLPVIVISAQNTIVTAIRANEAAAFDYLPKPFDLPDLMARVRSALSQRVARAAEVAPQTDAADPALPLIGHAPAMQDLFRLIARVLNADLPVLVSGEAGVGRTTIARSLHDLSERSGRTLVTLAPADDEDQLARAVAAAVGGSVLIEDLAGFASGAQARLAAMTEGWIAAPSSEAPRLLATVGPDPQADLAEGRLRGDLYWRLAGVTVRVPPLRERVDDIPALARHLLGRAAGQGLPARSLGDAAAGALRKHPFTGNLRELDNLMRRLALTAAGRQITRTEVLDALDATRTAASPSVDGGNGTEGAAALAGAVEAHLRRYFTLHGDQLPPAGLFDRVMAEVERPLLELSLEATGGNQLRAAELLGINRNTLRAKLSARKIGVTRRRKLV